MFVFVICYWFTFFLTCTLRLRSLSFENAIVAQNVVGHHYLHGVQKRNI